MITEEKLEKLKKLANAMYYAAQHLTTDASRLHKAMDEYHKFIVNEYHKEESVSEDNTLRKASEEYLKVLSETPYNNTPITNAQTIVRELISFLDNPSKYNPNHIEEPVSEDLGECINDLSKQFPEVSFAKLSRIAVRTAKWQKEQMLAKAFDFTKEHNIACVLASECLRNHGWFGRERDFNNLFRHLSCVDKLFEGKFSGKTKVIVIKED